MFGMMNSGQQRLRQVYNPQMMQRGMASGGGGFQQPMNAGGGNIGGGGSIGGPAPGGMPSGMQGQQPLGQNPLGQSGMAPNITNALQNPQVNNILSGIFGRR